MNENVSKALDFLFGLNREKINLNEAVVLFKKESDNPVAAIWLKACQSILNVLYSDSVDYTKVFSQLIERSDSEAQNCVGYCYETETGVKSDKNKAEEWYLKSAQQNNSIAEYNLGCLYQFRRNNEKSKFYYFNSSKKGNACSQYLLGYIYEEEQDLNSAKYWYEQSANQNHATARIELFRLVNQSRPYQTVSSFLKLTDKVPEKENIDILCYICKENNRSILLLPCKHLCACFSCAKKLLQLSDYCPVCREKVEHVIQIYH